MSVFVFVIWGCVCRWHTGGWLPNVCVSHAANSSLTGLLSSHLDLHCITPIVFLPCTSWISLAAVLDFSHPNPWFIVCLSLTLSQFVENTNSVQKKEFNTQFTSSLWTESILMRKWNVAEIQSVKDGGRKCFRPNVRSKDIRDVVVQMTKLIAYNGRHWWPHKLQIPHLKPRVLISNREF